jgi:hypothetical protein
MSVDLEKCIYDLYRLLDDIDTLDDAVKTNDKAFREHARTIQRKRHDVVPTWYVDKLYNKFYPTNTTEGE